MKQKLTLLMVLFSIWGMSQIRTITSTNADLDGSAIASSYAPPALSAADDYRALVKSDGDNTGISNVVSTFSCGTATPAPIIRAATNYTVVTSTYVIPCGDLTANLSGLTASNKPTPATTTLTWHTATPATAANRISDITALPGTMKYYAAFFDSVSNCYSLTKQITVHAPICATDDDYTALPVTFGVGRTLPNVFGNDSYNGLPIVLPLSNVVFEEIIWIPEYAEVSVIDGTLYIPPTTPLGTHTFWYSIIDKDTNSILGSNVSYASVTFTVIPNSTCGTATPAPIINAATNYTPVTSSYAIPCGDVTANLSGLTASNNPSPATTTLTWHTATPATVANKITDITALPGTAKYYAAFFDSVNNCYSSTKEIVVYAPICASNDDYTSTPITFGVGGTLPNIFGNDTYNGLPIVLPLSNVKFEEVIWTNSLAQVSVVNGSLYIPPTTPPGSYTFTYSITDLDADGIVDSNTSYATVTFVVLPNSESPCNEPPNDLSASVPVHHGITLLGRGGADNSNWPMERNSAYTALEAKTKGFVITRISDPETAIATPVVGMMVFDTDENAGKGCLKIYTGSAPGEGWKCFTTPTCP